MIHCHQAYTSDDDLATCQEYQHQERKALLSLLSMSKMTVTLPFMNQPVSKWTDGQTPEDVSWHRQADQRKALLTHLQS